MQSVVRAIPLLIDTDLLAVGEWKEAMTEGGKKYYWYGGFFSVLYRYCFRNTVTRESRWEKPK